jgi:hypothetical protein
MMASIRFKPRSLYVWIALPSLLWLLLPVGLLAQVPQLINYQGRVAVDGVNFDGSGQFKFALINTAGTTTYWSNDGSSSAGSEPTATVTLPVTKGLYSVLLGDATLTNMTLVPATVFANGDVHLRVWFNDGLTGFQQLTPDRRIAAVGYAMMADSVVDGAVTTAKIANGAVTAQKIASGAVGSLQMASGAVTSTKIASGAVGGPQIASGAIGSTHIASGAIGSSQIAPGAVTQAALAPGVGQPAKPVQSGRITAFPGNFFGAAEFNASFPSSFINPPIVALSTLDAQAASPPQVGLLNISNLGFTGFYSSGRPPNVFASAEIGSKSISAVSPLLTVAGTPAYGQIEVDSFENDYSVRFVRATNSNGQNVPWSTSAPILTTSSSQLFTPDLAIVSSNPAMAFFQIPGGLRYVRATTSDGSSWSSTIAVDTTITSFGGDYRISSTRQVSLLVVSGNPAVAYYDETNGDLKFARASNSTGTTWSAPVIVQSVGDVGAYPQLVIVSGMPAIAYYDVSNGDLKFVRASNLTGTTWGAPVTVSSVGDVGKFVSLALVNGNPSIAYYDVTNADLKFVRSTNADGSAWGTPVTPDSVGDVGVFAFLAVVGGVPAIAYHEDQLDDIKVVRAKDENGANWSKPVTIATEGFVGTHVCMAEVNGEAAALWMDLSQKTVVFCRSISPTLTINWMAQEP